MQTHAEIQELALPNVTEQVRKAVAAPGFTGDHSSLLLALGLAEPALGWMGGWELCFVVGKVVPYGNLTRRLCKKLCAC